MESNRRLSTISPPCPTQPLSPVRQFCQALAGLRACEQKQCIALQEAKTFLSGVQPGLTGPGGGSVAQGATLGVPPGPNGPDVGSKSLGLTLIPTFSPRFRALDVLQTRRLPLYSLADRYSLIHSSSSHSTLTAAPVHFTLGPAAQ